MVQSATTASDWIVADWGTTNLRVWRMSEDGSINVTAKSDQGMGMLKPYEFEDALLTLIKPWISAKHVTNVIACCMVGAIS